MAFPSALWENFFFFFRVFSWLLNKDLPLLIRARKEEGRREHRTKIAKLSPRFLEWENYYPKRTQTAKMPDVCKFGKSWFSGRRFTESPGPLPWIEFPVEILTNPPWFTELPPPFSLKTPFFHWKVLRRIPSPNISSDKLVPRPPSFKGRKKR